MTVIFCYLELIYRYLFWSMRLGHRRWTFWSAEYKHSIVKPTFAKLKKLKNDQVSWSDYAIQAIVCSFLVTNLKNLIMFLRLDWFCAHIREFVVMLIYCQGALKPKKKKRKWNVRSDVQKIILKLYLKRILALKGFEPCCILQSTTVTMHLSDPHDIVVGKVYWIYIMRICTNYNVCQAKMIAVVCIH